MYVNLELLGSSWILGAIQAAHSHICCMKRLGHQSEDGLRLLAVAAPWRVEHHQPLALMSHIDEAITQFQNARRYRRRSQSQQES